MKIRQIAKVMVAIGLAIGLPHLISILTFDRIIKYNHVPFYSKKIPAELDGYKVAFISDTHSLPAKKLEAIVRNLNELKPDILVLGGDFPSSPGAAMRSMAVLSKVVAKDGIYGVEGNHDDYVELFAAMERYDIQPLSNSGVALRKHLYLAGLEDLWNRIPDIQMAIGNSNKDDFIIIAVHNPDATMCLDTSSVDLIISGHTHGGHATVFGLWAPVLTMQKKITVYGSRFQSGWCKSRDETPVYVSNGVGTFVGVPRVFARPEVVILTLRSSGTASLHIL